MTGVIFRLTCTVMDRLTGTVLDRRTKGNFNFKKTKQLKPGKENPAWEVAFHHLQWLEGSLLSGP